MLADVLRAGVRGCDPPGLRDPKACQAQQPALEVLTIIAYYQPTTRAYVDQIGAWTAPIPSACCWTGSSLRSAAGSRSRAGPRLYRTTKQFLRAFHLTTLDDLRELPDLGGEGQMRINEDGQIVDPAEEAEITGADHRRRRAPWRRTGRTETRRSKGRDERCLDFGSPWACWRR